MLQGTPPPAAIQPETPKGPESFKDAIKKATDELLGFNKAWENLDKLSAEFVKNTGMGMERTREMETSITQSATEILKFSKGIYSYEQALARSAKIVNEISLSTSRSLVGNAKEIEGIAVAMEASNVPSEKLVANFKQAGFALGSIPKEMEKVVNYTRSIGVNTAQVSGMVVDNLKNLNLYNFENGIQGITKMAAQSALFGVSMGRIFAISEDLFNPEKAIEMAASFQRLGVSTSALLDPLKLMDMGQNNPQELQNQIVEMTKKFTYFDEKNQKFQILPGAQREMREIAGVLGMGADELARMAIGSSELSEKMNKIKFPTLKTGPMTEEQKQMIANMSEMRGGEYKVMVEQTDAVGNKTGIMKETSITELSDKDVEMLSKSGEKKPLEDIAKEQLQALNRIYNAITSNVTAPLAGALSSSTIQGTRGIAYSAQAKIADASESIIKPEQMTNMTNSLVKAIASIAEKKISGEDVNPTDLIDVTKSLKDSLNDVEGNFNEAKGKAKDEAKIELEKFRSLLRSGSNNASQTPQQIQQIQTPQQIQQIRTPQEIEEPDSSGSAMSAQDVTALVSGMMPDNDKLARQIEVSNETQSNGTLAKIESKLNKNGLDEDKIGKLTEHFKLTQEQIDSITKVSSNMLSNQTQKPQTIDQSKEQTGIANMIKPEELKGLVDEMLPDFQNYANQIKNGNKGDAEKTGKEIELQLSKVGMDDKTMKMFTDMIINSGSLTEEQIKTLAKSSQVMEKNETQKPQIAQQPQTQTETQGPKLSWMKQIDAFDKVTQGTAGETQTVTNSQVKDLNNQTVTAANNNQQQQTTNQSDYLIDIISKATQPQTQIVEHKFEGTITIKVDAPAGVDSAYVTKTINDMVNSPAFTDKMIKSQEVMANNYGLTGGKVGAYNNTSGMGMA